jgi:hypothetical protein
MPGMDEGMIGCQMEKCRSVLGVEKFFFEWNVFSSIAFFFLTHTQRVSGHDVRVRCALSQIENGGLSVCTNGSYDRVTTREGLL